MIWMLWGRRDSEERDMRRGRLVQATSDTLRVDRTLGVAEGGTRMGVGRETRGIL